MKWIVLLVYLYFAYYTFSYAAQIWKNGNRFASAFIAFLSFSLVGLPVWVLFIRS